MTLVGVVVAVLLVSWAATVIGALLGYGDPAPGSRRPRRPRGREIVDALALPLSAIESKHKRGRKLSALRILAYSVFAIAAGLVRAPLGGWDVAALGLGPLLLILDTLLAQVPASEFLAALTAVFGAAVAKRTRTVQVEEELELPTPPAHPGPDEEVAGDGGTGARG